MSLSSRISLSKFARDKTALNADMSYDSSKGVMIGLHRELEITLRA
jgi:hypothetical protein